MWEARCEPTVIEPFAKLYGTDELLVSFDSFNIGLPRRKDLTLSPGRTVTRVRTGRVWLAYRAS